MAEYRIGIRREDNLDYYNLFDEYNNLMDRFNKINLFFFPNSIAKSFSMQCEPTYLFHRLTAIISKTAGVIISVP